MLPYRKDVEHIFVIIAIGSNLEAPDGCGALQNCARAVRAVADLPGVFDVVVSRWYSSAPLPPSDQERYINATASFNTSLPPDVLLGALQCIEERAGRARSIPNAARVIDLDIVSVDQTVRKAPDPVLPHPRAHVRAFVLSPLRDVDPLWAHPVTHLTIHELLASLPGQDIQAL